MKRNISTRLALVGAFLLQTQFVSWAQEIDFERYEIGIDMLPLINKSVIPPSVFVKKLLLKQKEKDFGFVRRGLRLRIGCEIAMPAYSIVAHRSNYDVLFRPGYEWDRRIRSIDVFYGLDLMSRFQRSYFDAILDGVNNTTIRTNFLDLGVSPFVGINYKIVKNLKASLESNLDLLFRRREQHLSQGLEPVSTLEEGILIRANPIYVLNAVFVF